MYTFIEKSKKGIIIGTALGTVIMLYFLIFSHGPVLPDYSLSSIIYLIFVYVFPIILSGAINGLLIEGILVKRFILPSHFFENCRTGSVAGCIIGGVVFFPLGIFLSIVIGGVWGGAIGGAIGSKIGVSKMGIFVGIAITLVLFIIIVTLIGAIVGMLVGFVFNRIIRKRVDTSAIASE